VQRIAAAAQPPLRSPMGRLKTAAIFTAVIVAVNEAGLQNVMAAAATAIVLPVATTAFVYEVSALRGTQLAHEAQDRADYIRVATGEGPAPELAPKVVVPEHPNLAHKLDRMIASRANILDIFGDEPSTVAPVYRRIIKGMLDDDNATFASLSAPQDDGSDPETLVAKAARLRAIHTRLVRLSGA
jgi:hypothetical protein